MAGLTFKAGAAGEAEARSLKTHMEAVKLVDEDVKNQMVQTGQDDHDGGVRRLLKQRRRTLSGLVADRMTAARDGAP